MFPLLTTYYLLLTPASALAASCACFCGTVATGAVKGADQADANSCAASCSKDGTTYVGCFSATDETQWPRYSDICWTAAECGGWSSASLPGKATFGGQNEDCEKQPGTGDEMGYCYPPLSNLTLNVPILGTTQVGNLMTYINLLYTYAIPAGAVIAVMMITLGGFQYMTAGGSKKGVTQGKERITNALIGLLLLFGAFAIARLIDPRLVILSQLQTPLIKQAVALSSSTTCEQLRDSYGYGVSDATSGAEKCGDKGQISSVDKVTQNVATGTWKVGDTCYFSGGCSSGQICLVQQNGTTIASACVACKDAHTGATGSSAVTPSSSTCQAIATQLQASDPTAGHNYICEYQGDFSIGGVEASPVGGACVGLGVSTSHPYLDCNELSGNFAAVLALNGGDYCSLYGWLSVFSADTYGTLNVTADFGGEYQNICTTDPCGYALASKKSSCTYTSATSTSGSCSAK